jgi:hypothetical protein
MNAPTATHVAGLEPWLPWPLRAWPWWTEPVRAEGLAIVRIALALCLLVDILVSYRPHLLEFFGSGGLGGAEMFAYYSEPPKLNWSLLRGLGDPLLGTLGFIIWMFLTAWIVLDFWALYAIPREQRSWRGRPWSIVLWLVSGVIVMLGVWSRSDKLGQPLLVSWQDHAGLLTIAFWTWVASVVLLLVGFWTRAAAIAAWALTMSFANVNPNIDNAGDTIRGIILFYLMLSPCGAVWSIDRWLQNRRGGNVPTHVYPWALRLLFFQLVFIYFMNGLYKLTGSDWLAGDSLHYVLCDLSLTRFSREQLPIPFVVTQLATWLVLVWEVTFPVLVIFRRTRFPALLFGVAFHLGIFLTMELGGFVPYVLCLYLPLCIGPRQVSDAHRTVASPLTLHEARTNLGGNSGLQAFQAPLFEHGDRFLVDPLAVGVRGRQITAA